jgi:hypothetical protein
MDDEKMRSLRLEKMHIENLITKYNRKVIECAKESEELTEKQKEDFLRHEMMVLISWNKQLVL